jgi:hypothetical protein
MRKSLNEGMVQHGVATVVLVALSACNVASSTADAATNVSTTAAGTTPSGSLSGATSTAGLGSTSKTSGTTTGSSTSTTTTTGTILFEQPLVSSVAGNFVVPPATHTAPPKGVFKMVLWQPDRFQTNGLPVPTGWDAGSRTGFTPASATISQLGFQNRAGTSTGQMEGDTVGAYLNSQDLPPSSADQKMMMTPQLIFPSGSQPMPFLSTQSSLHGALDLQVPTAVGSDAYVNADLLFKGPSGVRISISTSIFHNRGVTKAAGTGYDSPSNTYMLNSPLGVDQRFITKASTSAAATGTPWSGWRHFEWSMTEAQFVSALQHLNTAFPGQVTSIDPAQYVLAEIHLNAELHTRGQAAQLGWSMQGLKLWSTP